MTEEATKASSPSAQHTPGQQYRVIAMSDCGKCDCCGKTNLKRTVHLENLSSGEDMHFGVDCASSALRQRYQGKRYPVSREAVKSMAARARTERVLLEAA